MTLTKVDRYALQRAMDIAAADDPGRAEQLASKLKDEPWEEVAKFAAYCVQGDNLCLQPWERVPMEIADTGPTRPEDRGARILLKKLLDAGLSRFEPDPICGARQVARLAEHGSEGAARCGTRACWPQGAAPAFEHFR